jgi:hypothetical protein
MNIVRNRMITPPSPAHGNAAQHDRRSTIAASPNMRCAILVLAGAPVFHECHWRGRGSSTKLFVSQAEANAVMNGGNSVACDDRL